MQRFVIISAIFLITMIPTVAYAVGGCGCAHVSPRAMAGLDVSALTADPDLRTLGNKGKLRIGISNQFAEFDRFYADGLRVTDPRERSAFISSSVLGIDLGIFDRLTLSMQIPYVIKNQRIDNPPPSPAGLFPKNPAGEDWTPTQIENFQTKVRPQLAERNARGIGDLSFSLASDLLPNTTRASGLAFIVSAGMRLPTGSIEEDGGSSMKLPQPFQLGSGHPELLAGAMLMKSFETFALFGVSQARIPLARNKFDYVFGKELSVALGGVYALPFLDKRIRVGGLLDFSEIEKDNVQIVTNYNINDPKGGHRIVSYPLVESNGDIKNTGGRFLYLGPTLEVEPVDDFMLSASLSFLLIKEANGDASRTNAKGALAPLGQVLAEGLFQLSAAYTFSQL
jgi:hypothetical protein